MEWSNEAREFLDSRRQKLSGNDSEIDLAIDRIRKDSEKAAARAGATVVEKEHVRQAIAGLPKIEVVTEATEGSFAFVRVLIILGGIMLLVGVFIQVWYQNLAKYGEEPGQNMDIFILRYMLYAGIAALAASGILFWWGRKQTAEEWEEEPSEEGSSQKGEEESPGEGDEERSE